MTTKGYYEVFNYKTGKVVDHVDTEWDARARAEKLGSDFDYDVCECDD